MPSLLAGTRAFSSLDQGRTTIGNLIQTLLREKLVDRMHVWTHPVTIGVGKRLFAEGTRPATWKLMNSRVGDAGVIIHLRAAGRARDRHGGRVIEGTVRWRRPITHPRRRVSVRLPDA